MPPCRTSSLNCALRERGWRHSLQAFHAAIACSMFLLAASGDFARADGWHNAALATASLDQWLSDVKRVVPDLDARLKNTELRSGVGSEALKKAIASKSAPATSEKSARGGTMQNNLTPQQQQFLARKAGDCLEVLAYMDVKNIFPHEFPTFQLGKIPEYRRAASQLLKAMGTPGAEAVAQKVRSELMGAEGLAFDVTKSDRYYTELLALLKDQLESGTLSVEDAEALAEAAAGQKQGASAGLAQQVLELLEGSLNLATLLKWSQATSDATRKRQLNERFRKRVVGASQDELLTALKSPDAQEVHKKAIADQINRKLTSARIVELLATMEEIPEIRVQRAADAELGRRNPTFKDVEPELPELAKYFASPNQAVSDGARRHLANAFQRAPLAQCLEWLGKGNARLTPVIWEQIDGRIARADADRLASYSQTAIAALGSAEMSTPARAAALQLLVRLKSKSSAGEIIELVPLLPRELWPQAGSALEQITGQKFGPRTGDGAAEVSVAVKKWREWWQQAGSK